MQQEGRCSGVAGACSRCEGKVDVTRVGVVGRVARPVSRCLGWAGTVGGVVGWNGGQARWVGWVRIVGKHGGHCG